MFSVRIFEKSPFFHKKSLKILPTIAIFVAKMPFLSNFWQKYDLGKAIFSAKSCLKNDFFEKIKQSNKK